MLGIDAREGRVATDGWLETSDTSAVELAQQFDDEPLAANDLHRHRHRRHARRAQLAAMREMRQAVRMPVIASGGVTTADDVASLAEAGVAGCIIGRSLYEGQLTIRDALAGCRKHRTT